MSLHKNAPFSKSHDNVLGSDLSNYDIAVKILTCVSKAFLTQKKPVNNNPKFVSHFLRHSVYHIYVILFPPHYFVFILLII
jgi:hypothetical protein